VIPLFGSVCSLQQRAVNKLASKFGVNSDDAMLKQIKIADTTGRSMLLFTPFEPADLTQFLSAAQMSALMPHEEPVANPSSKHSADTDLDARVTESPADSPSAPAPPPASATADGGSSPANTPSAVISVSDPNGDAQIAGGNAAKPDAASAPPELHPNAVAGDFSA
jgi:hypothetical protein